MGNFRVWIGRFVFTIVISLTLCSPLFSTEKMNDHLDIGLQYRIMYDNSNIRSTKEYDFFRQRLRFGMDFHPEDGAGGYIQLEYRGGWGGSSPVSSDPRGGYAVNPYNRLQARGIRYGYLYFPSAVGKFIAGIIPLDDQTDQMLFSAYYDLNVGGVSLTNDVKHWSYRLAYVRLADGVMFRNDMQVGDKDEHFVLVDINRQIDVLQIGVHWYGVYGDIIKDGVVSLNHSWIGSHVNYSWDNVTFHGLVLYNTGEISPEHQPKAESNGWLVRTDVSATLNKCKLEVMGLFSSGASDGAGFQTLHAIIGTSGYWAYTHLFTYDGPSGVNDYALEAGNLGYGLTTVQTRMKLPLSQTIVLHGTAAWLISSESMPLENNQTDNQIGTELTAFLTVNLNPKMTLDFGSGVVFLGEAGKQFYQHADTDLVNEIFARVQFVY